MIVSPDQANDALRTVLVAPLTSVQRAWPTRVPVTVAGVDGDVALDQIRALDKRRLRQRIGALARDEQSALADRLVEVFAL